MDRCVQFEGYFNTIRRRIKCCVPATFQDQNIGVEIAFDQQHCVDNNYNRHFTDSDTIFEMSIRQCIIGYSWYMKSKQPTRTVV